MRKFPKYKERFASEVLIDFSNFEEYLHIKETDIGLRSWGGFPEIIVFCDEFQVRVSIFTHNSAMLVEPDEDCPSTAACMLIAHVGSNHYDSIVSLSTSSSSFVQPILPLVELDVSFHLNNAACVGGIMKATIVEEACIHDLAYYFVYQTKPPLVYQLSFALAENDSVRASSLSFFSGNTLTSLKEKHIVVFVSDCKLLPPPLEDRQKSSSRKDPLDVACNDMKLEHAVVFFLPRNKQQLWAETIIFQDNFLKIRSVLKPNVMVPIRVTGEHLLIYTADHNILFSFRRRLCQIKRSLLYPFDPSYFVLHVPGKSYRFFSRSLTIAKEFKVLINRNINNANFQDHTTIFPNMNIKRSSSSTRFSPKTVKEALKVSINSSSSESQQQLPQTEEEGSFVLPSPTACENAVDDLSQCLFSHQQDNNSSSLRHSFGTEYIHQQQQQADVGKTTAAATQKIHQVTSEFNALSNSSSSSSAPPVVQPKSDFLYSYPQSSSPKVPMLIARANPYDRQSNSNNNNNSNANNNKNNNNNNNNNNTILSTEEFNYCSSSNVCSPASIYTVDFGSPHYNSPHLDVSQESQKPQRFPQRETPAGNPMQQFYAVALPNNNNNNNSNSNNINRSAQQQTNFPSKQFTPHVVANNSSQWSTSASHSSSTPRVGANGGYSPVLTLRNPMIGSRSYRSPSSSSRPNYHHFTDAKYYNYEELEFQDCVPATPAMINRGIYSPEQYSNTNHNNNNNRYSPRTTTSLRQMPQNLTYRF